ncbi:MAG: hypothetical protein AAF565_19135 [Pseudomonadota bacterium]
MNHHHRRYLHPFALALILAGCASDREIARQMAGEGPDALDPSAISVAVVPPEGMGIAPGGATLSLSAEGNDWAASESFVLAQQPDVEAPGLPADARVTALALAPEDVERFRVLAREIGRRELDDPDSVNGSLSAAVDPCRVGGTARPSGPLLIFLRMQKERPYKLLSKEVDFADQVIRSRATEGALPPCPEPGRP